MTGNCVKFKETVVIQETVCEVFCISTPNSIHFSLDLSETCWKRVFHPGDIKQGPVGETVEGET